MSMLYLLPPPLHQDPATSYAVQTTEKVNQTSSAFNERIKLIMDKSVSVKKGMKERLELETYLKNCLICAEITSKQC